MVSAKGESFRIFAMIPHRGPRYSLEVKDRVKGLEKRAAKAQNSRCEVSGKLSMSRVRSV